MSTRSITIGIIILAIILGGAYYLGYFGEQAPETTATTPAPAAPPPSEYPTPSN
jgi:hypothetical protein